MVAEINAPASEPEARAIEVSTPYCSIRVDWMTGVAPNMAIVYILSLPIVVITPRARIDAPKDLTRRSGVPITDPPKRCC